MAMTIPVVIVAVVSLQKSTKVLHGKFREFYAQLRGPLLATERMGIAMFVFRMVLADLLPSRVPFPFAPNGVSEVTIVLVLGVSAGIALYFGFLRLFDRETYDGMSRLLVQIARRRFR